MYVILPLKDCDEIRALVTLRNEWTWPCNQLMRGHVWKWEMLIESKVRNFLVAGIDLKISTNEILWCTLRKPNDFNSKCKTDLFYGIFQKSSSWRKMVNFPSINSSFDQSFVFIFPESQQ